MSKKQVNNVDQDDNKDSDVNLKFDNPLRDMSPYTSSVAKRQVFRQMVSVLPEKIQNRICALKNIQLEQIKLEPEFYKEVYELEKKYHERFSAYHEQRQQIISGKVEPEKQEPKWPNKTDDVEELDEKLKDLSLKIGQNFKSKYPENVNGIPDFWLTIFRSTGLLLEIIQEHDEPVLQKLNDVKLIYAVDEMSFIIEFHFDENDYFRNKVLTKQYFLKPVPDETDTFNYEGPEIYKCIGCNIDWKKGKNLTVKTIRKKQKHKESGSTRTIAKQIPNESFFNFFNPPIVGDDKDDDDDVLQEVLTSDFEIGNFLRTRLINRAVLYYTGDLIDDDDDCEEEEDEEEYDYEDNDDDEDNEDEDENDGNDDNEKKEGGKNKTINKIKTNPNECPNQ